MFFIALPGIKKNVIFQTLPKYYGNYNVSLDVIPRGKIGGWGNILHVTKGGDMSSLGDRMPGIWFNPRSLRLHICTSIDNKHNYCVNTRSNLPIGKSTNIQTVQKCDELHQCVYQIFINGLQIHKTVNRKPLSLENVRVYLSDPWYHAANAVVKNLKVVTTPFSG